MILKAKERGNAPQLAKYLLSMRDNEHVELHELRGFVSEDLIEAFEEAEALAKGTKCKNHLFSMSLNPPQSETVDREAFERAVEAIEQRLELEGHARALVFHERDGRRHAHAVWSRIDTEEMRAKNMAFYKQKLMDVSRDLYLEHGWEMPKGMLDKSMRNPLNYSREEWQQAKRAKQDPKLIKAAIQQCWQTSDNTEALKAALEDKGFFLAKGDRRGVVAIDVRGEAYSLARWSGVKTKDVRERIKDADTLPSASETKAQIASRMTGKLKSYLHEVDSGYRRLSPSIEHKREQMITAQQQERRDAYNRIAERERRERQDRASRLPKGFSGIWSRITGKSAKIEQKNEMEALRAWHRDRAEKDRLVARQLDERQRLQQAIDKMRMDRAREVEEIRKEIAAYIAMKRGDISSLEAQGRAKKQSQTRKHARHRAQERDQGRNRGPGFER